MNTGSVKNRLWISGAILVIFSLLLINGPLPAQAAPLMAPAYPSSQVITGINFDWNTHQRLAPGSDNWPITWADDDHQYSSWGDGGGFGGTNQNGRVSLGFARIEGSATNYAGYNVWGGVNPENPAQFTGKSYGIISIDGKLYTWRCGDGSMETAYIFQRLYVSTNHSATWDYTGVEFTQGYFGNTRGFFCPTFLQFGKDYAGARDNYVYMYAPEIKTDRWDIQRPGEITLLRVAKANLGSRSAYEFFAGLDGSGNPTWTTNAANRRPVFSDATNGVMLASALYNAGLGRYLLTVAHSVRASGSIGIYDAPSPWGPWTTVLFESGWGSPTVDATTFFWNFSNKWTSADGKNFTFVFTGTGTNDTWNSVRGSFTTSGSPPPPTTPPPTEPPTQPPTQPTATPVPPTQVPTQPPVNPVTIQVNFQPGAASPPAGYFKDDGSVYGERGNGYAYGWSGDNSANTRDRNSSLSPDEAHDTLNHLQRGGEYTWEIALPNGEYMVTIVAGDPGYYDSVYKINAEGVLVVNGIPSNANPWMRGSAAVTVNDGRLTVSSAAGSQNNKIALIQITSMGPATGPIGGFQIYLPSLQR